MKAEAEKDQEEVMVDVDLKGEGRGESMGTETVVTVREVAVMAREIEVLTATGVLFQWRKGRKLSLPWNLSGGAVMG